jgi:hypothetical protein
MTHGHWPRLLLVAVICLAIGGTALAASKSHSYAGTTAQTDPKTGKSYPTTFKIAHGKIKGVDTHTLDTCPDGSLLHVHQNAFKPAALDSKGRFTLRAGTPQQPAVMKGKVKGKQASGTLSDKTADTAGSGTCTAKTTWTATRK